MKTISAKVPDETAEKFEQIILIRRLQGDDVSKSAILRELVADWVEEHEDVLDDVDVEP